MNLFQKTIFTGFAPNLRVEDILHSLFPRRGSVEAVEQRLANFFGVSYAITFDSGRTGLAMALKALDVGPGADVLVQAYTCVVVVNAIRAAGAQPIFVDTKDNFFMDPADAERKMTPRTKVMIIQHTFGIPADMDALLAVAQKQRLKVIEDCAHTIGGTYRGKLLGTFGDSAMFSFGSDKVISSVRGGAVVTNNSEAGERLRALQKELPQMRPITLFQHLLHGPIFFIAKPLYHLGIGKAILWAAKKLRLMSRIISDREKAGGEERGFPSQFPEVLADIASRQLLDLEEMNLHRQRIVALYAAGIKNANISLPQETRAYVSYAYLRYPVITENPKRLRLFAKRQGIILGDWYDSVVAPCVNGCPHAGYRPGSCPHAERDAKGSVNLPTDLGISEKDTKRIIDCLNRYE
jgi:dTDP-4-amino-4,6-dideoxygalactose transaminase